MAENPQTPSGQTPTTPNAPVVPAAVAPAPASATPPVTPAPTTPTAPVPAATVTPPATPPVVAATPPVTPPAVTPPVVPVVPPVVAGPPEKYEFALEGDQKVSQAAVDAITPALKEAGVSQEKATKLVKDFVAFQAGIPAAKNAADLEKLRQDPEIGLLNFGHTQNAVNEALAAFTTPAEREQLSKMGMANDLVLVRMFRRIGRAMAGAGQVNSDPRPPPEAKTTAQKLYGGTPKAQASQ